MHFYLAGEIGLLKDKKDAKLWRNTASKFLRNHGHSVENPMKMGNIWKELDKLRKEGKISEIREIMRRDTIPADLIAISKSDAILAYIKRYSVGTASELFFNYYILGKPNYIVCPLSKLKWNNWMIGMSTEIFNSWISWERYVIGEL